jgi:DNA-binding PadR family transcriptional regulator
MKISTSTEFVILGSLMPGSKHGYEIMQFLSSALEPAWRVSTSQLYLLLKRLELGGFVHSSLESQKTRPSKRVYGLTSQGKKDFVQWLQTPVEHVRDFRTEFLTKMFFFYHLALPGPDKLLDRQIAAVEQLKQRIHERKKKEDDAFMALVYGFKSHTIENLLTWLRQDVHTFVKEGIHDKCAAVETRGKKKHFQVHL